MRRSRRGEIAAGPVRDGSAYKRAGGRRPAARQIRAGAARGIRIRATLRENKTGLPDNLKPGIESLAGISLDNVNVHYNSSQPARLNALAYAQGSDIHVAPGQEQHLPHEAWHVVQQARGRVRPTLQLQDGVPVNDDAGLEHEADVMGAAAFTNVAHLQGVPEHQKLLQPVEPTPVQRAGPKPANASYRLQQRGGVRLAGGLGAAGELHDEQHADAVADLVVQGRSAEALLDGLAPGGAATTAVQRKIEGFSHVRATEAPEDVIAKVLEDGGFPKGLSLRQRQVICELINLVKEVSIAEVRRKLIEVDCPELLTVGFELEDAAVKFPKADTQNYKSYRPEVKEGLNPASVGMTVASDLVKRTYCDLEIRSAPIRLSDNAAMKAFFDLYKQIYKDPFASWPSISARPGTSSPGGPTSRDNKGSCPPAA